MTKVEHSDFIVYLKDIPPEGLVKEMEIAVADMDELGLAVRPEGALIARFSLDRVDERALVRGEVALPVSLECSRCLKDYVAPLEGTLETFLEEKSRHTEEIDEELSEEDMGVQPLEKGRIDLREMVAEQIHLTMPAKALCSEDCRGLCPTCGTDLNIKTCSCTRRDDDPRWDALRRLKVKES